MGSSFDTKNSLSYFFKIVEKLSEDQRNAVERVGFGHILKMQSQTLSKSLIVELIERWSCEKKAFLLPPGDVRIKLMDVALILGLRVTGEPVVLEKDLPFSGMEKDYGATKTDRSISVNDLEKRLKYYKTGVTKYFVTEEKRTEDFVRTFVLFIFGVFLFPNDLGTVDSRYLHFLNDLERIPQFAWGRVVREVLYEWMKKFKTDKKLRYMGSCLIFLQMWSFEHIDIARPSLPKGLLAFPRAYRWQNNGSRPRKWVTSKFQELLHNQIVWELEPTSEESNIDIIKDLLEKQNEISDLVGYFVLPYSLYSNLLNTVEKVFLLDNSRSHETLCLEEQDFVIFFLFMFIHLNLSFDHNLVSILDNEASDEILCLEEQFIDLENLEVDITDSSLKVQEDKIKIPSTSECCLNGLADLEDDAINEVLCLEEKFIELEDLQICTSENSMKVEDDRIGILSTSECSNGSKLEDGLRAETSCSKEQIITLEDSEVAVDELPLVQGMEILSIPQSTSDYSAGDVQYSRVLKDKILDSKECQVLRKENRTLKKENEELSRQNNIFITRLLSSEKLEEELREKIRVLESQLLSSETMLHNVEQLILLYGDTSGT